VSGAVLWAAGVRDARIPVSVFARPRGFVCAMTIAFAAGTALDGPRLCLAASAFGQRRGIADEARLRSCLRQRELPGRRARRAKIATRVNFDLVFASLTGPQRADTPSRREKFATPAGGGFSNRPIKKPTAAPVSAGESRLAVNWKYRRTLIAPASPESANQSADSRNVGREWFAAP